MTSDEITATTPAGAGRQIIHSDYVELMRQRAAGELPDMGCALRLGEIIKSISSAPIGRLIDVGCATGHYYRTFRGMGIEIGEYVGVEIDANMVAAAKTVWRDELATGQMRFVLDDIESPSPLDQCDFLVCANSFMYYRSAKRVLRKFIGAAKVALIRSYFADSNFRIIRGQSAQNNDRVQIDELELFSEAGDLVSADFWTIYGFTYIKRLVASLNPRANVEWLPDQNKTESIEAEARLGVAKRGGTQVIGGYEISYPLLQPWEILRVTAG
jgi:SAM-dependent methyltransferase